MAVQRFLKGGPPVRRQVRVGDVVFGAQSMVLIAGPCAVESLAQMRTVASHLKESGAHILRAGAFKPRTSPESFQGLGQEGLEILAQVSRETGLPVVTEVLSENDIEAVEAKADMLQVGARNMHNTALLKALSRTSLPILLKRGFAATIEEFLMAAEYLIQGGNNNVVLCERGVRSFETQVRFSIDFGSLALLRELSALPLVVDPSHATGQARLVRPVARAAAALGVDGIMVEVHPDPSKSVSDAEQAIDIEEFQNMVQDVRAIEGTLQPDGC